MVLADVIEESTDLVQLEELLLLNDSIAWLVSEIEKAGQKSPDASANTSPATSEGQELPSPDAGQEPSDVIPLASAKLNGLKLHIPADELTNTDDIEVHGDVISPSTPKVDKGKGRAGPKPELLEKALSPGFVIAGEEYDEDV